MLSLSIQVVFQKNMPQSTKKQGYVRNLWLFIEVNDPLEIIQMLRFKRRLNFFHWKIRD